MENEDKILRSYRRSPLCDMASMPTKLSYGRKDVERILPYREPFLLLDRISALDKEQKIIVGEYVISPQLALFKGHFPNYPVYPGSMQVEAIGQMGLCLVHFIENDTTIIDENAKIPNIRATRIGGAYYRGEVLPGDTLTLMAKVLEHDAYFGSLLGQVIVNETVKTVALLEVAFLD